MALGRVVKRSDAGRYATSTSGSEEVRAFVPAPLPPVPALAHIGRVRNSLDQGLLALGRLDGAARTRPDAHLLLYTCVRKEAVNRIDDTDGDASTERIAKTGDRA